MINGPPEVVGFFSNLDEHLVRMPLPLRLCTKLLGSFPSDLGCEDRTKTVPPEPNRFMTDVNAAFTEQILSIAKAEWKAKIQPDGILDDLRRKSMPGIEDFVHPTTLPCCQR